jgi:hypothetical protein
MTSRISLGVVAIALVVISSALMQTQALRIGVVSPNLLLVSLIIISFFSENILFYALIVLAGALFGRATPVVFDSYAVSTVCIALSTFIFGQKMVWPSLFGVVSIISVATSLTYLLIAPAVIWTHPIVWLLEILYNGAIGLLFFEIMRHFFGNNIRR